MSERREYRKKSEMAILYPKEFCSMIIDGADQSAFRLPHFAVKTKGLTGHAMQAKLVGVLETFCRQESDAVRHDS